MKRISCIALLFACAVYSASAQSGNIPEEKRSKYLDAMHRYITSDKLYGYARHFSDSTIFEGRLAGSPGMGRAVEWACGLFAQWELAPAPGNDGYIQQFNHPSVEIGRESNIALLIPVTDPDGTTRYIEKTYPWSQWYAGGTSGHGEITADVIYAGYGVTAPELGYDDYAGVDVRGKIVLIEGETPNTSRERDDLLAWYPYTLHQHKVANAVAHGAVGMLYKWVPGPNNGYDPGFVYAYVTQPVVDDIFTGTGYTYSEVMVGIKENKTPFSFDTGKKARIKMDAHYDPDSKGKNVIGILEGSDPVLKDEYIIVGAHLDHLGMIPHHIAGANDNNAATSVLMGVAEALARSEARPARSVLFVNFDGEEAGLTGSTYYTENPVVEQDRVKAVINLEQPGVGENIRISYRSADPWLQDKFTQANESFVHRHIMFRPNDHIPRPRTDGAVFMKAGYPTVDIGAYGGEWRGYYHDPRDDWQTLNPEILQDVAKLVYWTVILYGEE